MSQQFDPEEHDPETPAPADDVEAPGPPEDSEAPPLEAIGTPAGFETAPRPLPFSQGSDRPAWLVGADDALEGLPTPAEQRPFVPVPRPAAPAGGPTGVIQGGKPEAPKAWSGAASSIPKLTVVPGRERPEPEDFDDSDAVEESSDPETRIPAKGSALDPVADSAPAPPPSLRSLHEPWYLVWGEALMTQRRFQILALLGVLAVGGVLFFPRHREPGASLGSILRHPERYEGISVVVRGEALESFEIGSGFVYHLRQGRDTVVVFSPHRRPRIRDRVEVVGTVSTGYLDGAPRVALFESPASN